VILRRVLIEMSLAWIAVLRVILKGLIAGLIFKFRHYIFGRFVAFSDRNVRSWPLESDVRLRSPVIENGEVALMKPRAGPWLSETKLSESV